MPTPPPIRGGRSMPAVPNKRSFLDLSGELRNKVYSHLFKFEDPLLVVGVEEPELCRRVGDGNGSLKRTSQFRISDEGPWGLYDEVYPSSDGEIERASLRLGLLATCRQIYQEAASMLYGSNEFAITKTIIGLDKHDPKGTFIRGTSTWLVSLGSQVRMLKDITIDLDNLCPTSCTEYLYGSKQNFLFGIRSTRDYIDVGSLVAFLWLCDGNFNINFSYSKRDQHMFWMGIAAHSSGHSIHQDPEPTALMSMIQSLRTDSLGIKKFHHAIGSIGIARNGKSGVIVYKAGPKSRECCPSYGLEGPVKLHNCPNTRRFFTASAGNDLRMQPREPPNLKLLHTSIQNRIFNLVLHREKEVEIDVTNSYGQISPGSGFLFACRDFREDYAWKVWKNSFSLLVPLDIPYASFEALQPLVHRLHSPIPDVFAWERSMGSYCQSTSMLYNTMYMDALQVHLKFTSPGVEGLDELKIDALGLILAMLGTPGTRGEYNSKEHSIRISIHQDVDGQIMEMDNMTIALRHLWAVVEQTLTWCMARDQSIAHAKRPQIFINGRGKAISFRHSDTSREWEVPRLGQEEYMANHKSVSRNKKRKRGRISAAVGLRDYLRGLRLGGDYWAAKDRVCQLLKATVPDCSLKM
ncbi:hypothetical protein CC80DRAFT_505650 [Byssothecium circinans]|uniref:DUF7730 domain-containing protein n=1 Tax=Byssothecium circinans TaxID=147558 RepID=A0A6A5TUH2_9PLEO|nr:hypothetical protein CC80DRAFT_505650 [Byssothecium circinans]